jgi:hypothetical protein
MFGDAPQIQKIRHPNITSIKPAGLIERFILHNCGDDPLEQTKTR